MIERFQQLTKGSWRDRFKVAFWIIIIVDVILAPITFLVELLPALIFGLVSLFASLFARTMETKGFDDPVYKKNVQRLIERNRQFEEERNDRHS
jgi:hypothetical protein